MERGPAAARVLPWALVAALLVGELQVVHALRRLARVADQRDPIVLLEHPYGEPADALRAFVRAPLRTQLGLGAWMLPMLLLGALAWPRRRQLAWRGPALGLVAGILALSAWESLRDERVALRTLCWAAQSGVYDRPTRERALARGRERLATTSGRLAEALGAHARPSCDEAGRILGLP